MVATGNGELGFDSVEGPEKRLTSFPISLAGGPKREPMVQAWLDERPKFDWTKGPSLAGASAQVLLEQQSAQV